jgi:hypothetical protein
MARVLREAGIPQLLEKTIKVIEERGLSTIAIYDPFTKQPDIYGAILIAAGANESMLASGADNAVDSNVPPVNQVKIDVAIDYIEAMIDEDLGVWTSTMGKLRVIRMLRKAINKIGFSTLTSF